MDAVSSASVLPRGNTAMVAQWGREATGGDLFQIIATEANPSNYGEYLDRAADELTQNADQRLQHM